MALVIGNKWDNFIHMRNDGLHLPKGYRNKLGVTNKDDTILGGDGDDLIYGFGGNDTIDGGMGFDILVGGRGNDTYIVDDVFDIVVEKAKAGMDTVQAMSDFTLPDHVENLVLLVPGLMGTGNALANAIIGSNGNDHLDGGAGGDTLKGGQGDDTYRVDSILDQVIEDEKGGHDRVIVALASYVLPGFVEEAQLDASAGDGKLTGNAANNMLAGNGSANRLDGAAGADTMVGGAGDDTFIVDETGDQIIEVAGEGFDTILSSAAVVTLSANVEALVLAKGSVATDAFGNDADNILTGNEADNWLDGAAGADLMIGGPGNDVFVVDDALDSVIENEGEGIDVVLAMHDHALAADCSIEQLVLVEGSQATMAKGNGMANVMTGNSADNVLDGGAGDDVLSGGAGDDTYVVDGNDSVIEQASGGNDRVLSSTDFVTLASHVENLELTGHGDISGAGNALANLLSGNDGNNMLDGAAGKDILMGGAGADILTGGAGADVFRFATGDSGQALDSADVITDFQCGIDRIDISFETVIHMVNGGDFGTPLDIAAFVDLMFDHRDVVVVADALGSGDAWVMVDANRSSAFEDGDNFIVIKGVPDIALICEADFY